MITPSWFLSGPLNSCASLQMTEGYQHWPKTRSKLTACQFETLIVKQNTESHITVSLGFTGGSNYGPFCWANLWWPVRRGRLLSNTEFLLHNLVINFPRLHRNWKYNRNINSQIAFAGFKTPCRASMAHSSQIRECCVCNVLLFVAQRHWGVFQRCLCNPARAKNIRIESAVNISTSENFISHIMPHIYH
jgi:hypothetical protein